MKVGEIPLSICKIKKCVKLKGKRLTQIHRWGTHCPPRYVHHCSNSEARNPVWILDCRRNIVRAIWIRACDTD